MVFIVSLLSIGSLFSIGPIIEFLINPELHNMSALTQKAVNILKFFGLSITLKNWLFFFIIAIFLSSAFQVFARYSILKTKYTFIRDVLLKTFGDFLNAQWCFFSNNQQGVLINTFTRELSVLSDAFSSMALFFSSIIQSIFFLMVPFYISWPVTLISLGIAIILATPFILLGRYSYYLGKLNTSTANKIAIIVQENLTLIKVLLGFSNQYKSIENLKKAFNAHQEVTVKSQTLNFAIPVLYYPLGMIMVVIALFMAKHFSVPLAEITVLLLALSRFAISISDITTYKNALENFFPSYEQFILLGKQAQTFKQTSGIQKFNPFNKEITITDLSFSYAEHHPPALTHINISIPKGKMIALVGKSGSGKSTLIDIIMGFYEPTKGHIKVDGIPLQEYDIKSYRERIGYVPQDSILFNMSIYDNFLWANSKASKEDIQAVCQLAHADEFIHRFPDHYDTLVGDRGIRLSGGQLQRIALARALLRNPDILILDEATSSLDSESEHLIQQAIEKISKTTTIIVVAHRLSTIKNAATIYVLEKGNILEEGNYADLICKNQGIFKSMVQFQELGR